MRYGDVIVGAEFKAPQLALRASCGGIGQDNGFSLILLLRGGGTQAEG
jgi:hypothetical protein